MNEVCTFFCILIFAFSWNVSGYNIDSLVISEVAQSCPTLCDPMDCSLPRSSVHEIFQARILEWVVISFSWRSFQSRDWTCVSCIGRQILYHWAIKEAHSGFFLKMSSHLYLTLLKKSFQRLLTASRINIRTLHKDYKAHPTWPLPTSSLNSYHSSLSLLCKQDYLSLLWMWHLSFCQGPWQPLPETLFIAHYPLQPP